MAVEIERKFLVVGDQWRSLGTGVHYSKGYLCRDPERTVRVRRAGEKAYLTIKGRTDGISRQEFEYEIPLADATAMLALCDRPPIEKIRYCIPQGDLVWEVDEFLGANEGLVIAEIELRSPSQTFPKPDWVGPEVSGLSRYYNASLVSYPYSQWSPAERQSV